VATAPMPRTYVPLTYAQDVERLLAELKIDRFVAIGTSLGGIVTMLLAATGRERLAGVVLNDIGPAIEANGLARIKGYVGKTSTWPTWIHAARALGESNVGVYPFYRLEDWLRLAKRMYRLTPAGRIVPDYDKNIAEPFRLRGGETGVDLWPTLDALADVPTLIVRGELSDLFSNKTAQAMLGRLNTATLVTVTGAGHAPTLDEPEAVIALKTLLAKVVA
jgi:pimeloyl-ACP methyl ester carboxylesterase